MKTYPEPLPNTCAAISHKTKTGRISPGKVWGMLVLRSMLPFSLLLLLALAFRLNGQSSPIRSASAWWLWTVTLTNIVSILLLARLGRQESLRLRDLFFFNPRTWKADLRWFLVSLIGIALFVQLPGDLLSRLLWADTRVPLRMLMQPLPLAAIFPLMLLMPTTQALAELPVYWGYVTPRLCALGMKRWRVVTIVGLVLSLQHLFFSFQPDWRYDLWLALKYLPFALWTGYVVDRRPTVLPYLMLLHFMMDASLPVLVLLVTKGVLHF
jgi:hypothetical protein